MARKKGIRAFHIKLEGYALENKQGLRDVEQDLFSGFTRSVKLIDRPNIWTDMAADVIAPLYIPYTIFVLDDAVRRGVNKVYFLARDGYIFLQIAKSFQQRYPNLNLHYLYLSRKSIYLPSVYGCSANDFDYQTLMGRSVATILRSYKLDSLIDEDLADDFIISDEDDYSRFLNILERKKHEIIQKSSVERANLLGYLKQEGISGAEQVALVDLGWDGSVRKALSDIFRREGMAVPHTYYWGVNYENRRPVGAGEYDSFVYLEDLGRKMGNFCMLFEHYFSITNQSSTVGYELKRGVYRPIFSHSVGNDDIEEIQKINIDVCTEISQNVLRYNKIDEIFIQSLKAKSIRVLLRLKAYPSYAAASSLAFLQVEEPMALHGEKTVYNYIPHPSVLDVLRILLKTNKNRKRIWAEACLASWNKHLSGFLVGLYNRLHK